MSTAWNHESNPSHVTEHEITTGQIDGPDHSLAEGLWQQSRQTPLHPLLPCSPIAETILAPSVQAVSAVLANLLCITYMDSNRTGLSFALI